MQRTNDKDDDIEFRPQFAVPGEVNKVPRNKIPVKEMEPRTAFQIIHDELMLDGNARLNLATFVTTWMEPEADLLMAESADKNMIDKDEYPQTAELERRCVNIISDLWHAPESTQRRHRLLHHRFERSVHARRPRAQVALARPAQRGEEVAPTSRTS